MKILFIGDIYGKAGKDTVQKHLPKVIEQFTPDLVIANAENTSIGGKSLTRPDYEDLMSYGVEYFTMGNHTFRNEEFEDLVISVDNIVRPANA
jgi:calcineurin-like phosphoesterase